MSIYGEFLSLSPDPITTVRTSQPVWSPKTTNIEFHLVKDASAPAESEPARLAQMRLILRSFTASVTDRDSVRQELRLLPQPLFRYSQPDQGVVDGAIFAFVRSTNPEMLFLVQARKTDGEERWWFAPARFTGRGAELRYGDQVVWSHVARALAEQSSEDPYFQTLVGRYAPAP